jgi:hypothetical protein
MKNVSFSEENILSYCNIIDQFVSKYEWIIESKVETASEIEFPSLLFLRQMSDIADAISLLIKHGSGDAVDILLRNLFELEMNFEYLDSNYQENSIKFLYFYYRKKHELLSEEIPGTEQNLKLIEVLKQDSNVHADTLNFIKL